MTRIPRRWLLVASAVLLVSLMNAVQAMAQNAQPVPAPPASDGTAPMPRPMNSAETIPALNLPPAPAGCRSPGQVLQGPTVTEGEAPPHLKTGPVQVNDLPLAINLPTALQLADARPLVISAAQASLQLAVAQWQRARVLWIPTLNVGGSYLYHAGGSAGQAGPEFVNVRNLLMLGGGVSSFLAVTDAIFNPLAARQIVRAREAELQTARNDALLNVAEAYFNVQQERGRLAGMLDIQEKSRQLVDVIRRLSGDLTAPVEVNRAATQLADIERDVALRYQDWRVASADLTRELRLNPITVVEPVEPPELQVTLISPREAVDELVPIGLTNRPELAANRALVRATLVALRREKLRPLIPSVILAGNAVPVDPFGRIMGGAFFSTYSGIQNPWAGRFDPNIQLYWSLENFGFGNRALVREQRANNRRALVELFRIQDHVAADVVQAHARVQSAAIRVERSEAEIKQALITFAGNLKGIQNSTDFAGRKILINRPLEAVDSLRQLTRAYENYFVSVSDYNKAQFQLYRALGYPAGILACERNNGDIRPVDTSRPPQMAPVDAPPPCQRCGPGYTCR